MPALQLFTRMSLNVEQERLFLIQLVVSVRKSKAAAEKGWKENDQEECKVEPLIAFNVQVLIQSTFTLDSCAVDRLGECPNDACQECVDNEHRD